MWCNKCVQTFIPGYPPNNSPLGGTYPQPLCVKISAIQILVRYLMLDILLNPVDDFALCVKDSSIVGFGLVYLFSSSLTHRKIGDEMSYPWGGHCPGRVD